MKEVLRDISDKTLIPLGIAVFVIGGASAWMTSVDSRLQAQGARLDRQGTFYADSFRDIRTDIKEFKGEIQLDLRSIKEKLDSIKRSQN